MLRRRLGKGHEKVHLYLAHYITFIIIIIIIIIIINFFIFYSFFTYTDNYYDTNKICITYNATPNYECRIYNTYTTYNIVFYYIDTSVLLEKYTTRKIHTRPHPGLEWRIFHILTSEDVDAFGNIKVVS